LKVTACNGLQEFSFGSRSFLISTGEGDPDAGFHFERLWFSQAELNSFGFTI